MTDLVTGWTENCSIRNNASKNILGGIEQLTDLFPFAMVVFDSDCGGEFINHVVASWLQSRDIEQTRSRPYQKNDQAHVESKNNHVVRKHAFYWRYDTAAELDLMTVASVDHNSRLSDLSNFGPHVDIAAPGGYGSDGSSLLSTAPLSLGWYGRMSGTSMAAPMVAGAAADLIDQHPNWSGSQVADCMRTTATSTVTARNNVAGQKFTYSGSIPIIDLDAASTPGLCGGHAPFTQITAGYGHSCGVDTGGDAWCWGGNWAGQLGDGTVTVSPPGWAPVKVVGDHTFTQLAAGNYHTCGVDTRGDAWCWGQNMLGQLGDASTTDRSVPVKVD